MFYSEKGLKEGKKLGQRSKCHDLLTLTLSQLRTDLGDRSLLFKNDFAK